MQVEEISMKSAAYIALLGIALLGTAGCGGSGGGGGGKANSNPYAASYFRTYLSTTSSNPPNLIAFQVNPSGVVSGTMYTGATWGTGGQSLTGSVSDTGAASFTPSGGGTVTGMLSAAAASTMSSTLTGANNNTVYTALLVSPAKAAAGGSEFAGDYTGTITNNTKKTTGVLAFDVSSTGSITGMSLYDNNGTPEFTTMAGTISSTGAIDYTLTAGGTTLNTLTGTAALSNTGLTAPLTNDTSDSLTLNVYYEPQAP
jgi:hypothetical protein